MKLAEALALCTKPASAITCSVPVPIFRFSLGLAGVSGRALGCLGFLFRDLQLLPLPGQKLLVKASYSIGIGLQVCKLWGSRVQLHTGSAGRGRS